MSSIFFIILLFFIIFCIFIIIFTNDIKKSILTTCFISYLVVLYYLFIRAPDVAMTEVAVGSIMSTLVLMFGAKCEKNQNRKNITNIVFISIILIVFFVIVYFSTFGILPDFGNINNSINGDEYIYYCEETKNNFGFNNIVTAILASYRGFDTMCETLVVFIAGISIYIILGKNEK